MPTLVGPTAGRIWARNGLNLSSQHRRFWNAVPVHSCAASHWITIIFPLFDAGDMLRLTLLVSHCGGVAHLAHSVENSLRRKVDVHRQTDTERLSSYLFVIAMALRIGGV